MGVAGERGGGAGGVRDWWVVRVPVGSGDGAAVPGMPVPSGERVCQRAVPEAGVPVRWVWWSLAPVVILAQIVWRVAEGACR